jgi:hypothetical protein
MELPLAIAARESKGPDELYGRALQYFQTRFCSRPEADMSRVSLLSHDLPDKERAMMGAVIAGALVAMLDHKTHCGDLSKVPLVLMPPELQGQLDEIIITQGPITGHALLTSDLVLSRVFEWERKDYGKYKRWLRALNKAARVHQGKMTRPLTDPFLGEVKQAAVQQLRPVVARMQEKFAKQRRMPEGQQIVAAFDEETRNNPDAPFLSHAHNHELWLRFYRRDPVAYLHLSPEKIFDEFTGFVGTHDPEYGRQKISLLK